VGALTRQREIEAASLTGGPALLREATRYIGHPGIRARGTIGGTLAHNDPAAEYPAALLALDASVTARRSGGQRSIAVDDLLRDWLTTSLEPDELITEVLIPQGSPASGVAIAELAKREGDFALAGAVVRIDRTGSGTIETARVVAFGGLPRASRMRQAESILEGSTPSEDVLIEAAQAAGAEANPTDDIHATRKYRQQLVRVLTLRALRSAVGREA
jgi:CO/xanthine dehydrogenase FAD-binding subunit